jgi:hypothetical protein
MRTPWKSLGLRARGDRAWEKVPVHELRGMRGRPVPRRLSQERWIGSVWASKIRTSPAPRVQPCSFEFPRDRISECDVYSFMPKVGVDLGYSIITASMSIAEVATPRPLAESFRDPRPRRHIEDARDRQPMPSHEEPHSSVWSRDPCVPPFAQQLKLRRNRSGYRGDN